MSGVLSCPTLHLAVNEVIQRNDPPETPDYVPSGHQCCVRATCWYCEQERPTIPAGVQLGEN